MIQTLLVSLLLTCLLIVSEESNADLINSDDVSELVTDSNTTSSSPEQSISLWKPKISIHAGGGRTTLPYGSPGHLHYETKTRFTAVSFGAEKHTLHGSRGKDCYFGLEIKNFFPSSTRKNDLQAVSWIDLNAYGGALKYTPLAQNSGIQLLLGMEAIYERFHYPRGVIAFHGFPLRVGLSLDHKNEIKGKKFFYTLDTQLAYLTFGQTAVKYDSVYLAGSNQSVIAGFGHQKDVFGFDYLASFDVGFEELGKPSKNKEYPKHVISLIWQKRTRKADDFININDMSRGVSERSELNFLQSTFGLKWTETF